VSFLAATGTGAIFFFYAIPENKISFTFYNYKRKIIFNHFSCIFIKLVSKFKEKLKRIIRDFTWLSLL